MTSPPPGPEHAHHELCLQDLGFKYDTKIALENISFSITCGERLALLGPNGAGKSTLIRLIAGLHKLQKGQINWQGQLLKGPSSEIAYLPQLEFHQKQFPITVREIVEMGRYPHLGPFKKFTKIDQEKADSAIETMNLSSIAHRQIDELSGGQQQRCFIARALAQEAHVILLDEPFNGLDVESRCHLAVYLKNLSQLGHLIIASHHNIENTGEIFTKALVLNKKQEAFGEVPTVMANKQVQNILHSCHPGQNPLQK